MRLHVALLDEGVDVWRPVEAVPLGGDLYRIADQPYDRDAEHWEFEPGATVRATTIPSSAGPILAATAP